MHYKNSLQNNHIMLFGEKTRLVTALDLIKCFNQIKEQRLLLTCAPVLI